MKKNFIFLMIGLLFVFLVACGTNETSSDTDNNEITQHNLEESLVLDKENIDNNENENEPEINLDSNNDQNEKSENQSTSNKKDNTSEDANKEKTSENQKKSEKKETTEASNTKENQSTNKVKDEQKSEKQTSNKKTDSTKKQDTSQKNTSKPTQQTKPKEPVKETKPKDPPKETKPKEPVKETKPKDPPKETKPKEPKDTITISITSGADVKGTILSETKVPIESGDTALEPTLKILKEKKIQYNLVGSKGSAYMAAIDNLEEGGLAGWHIRVNGKMIDRSAGAWPIKAGDTINWNYTTNYLEDSDF